MRYYDNLNAALTSINLEMTDFEVNTIIGSINYEETKRFQFKNTQVVIFRMPSGRYEITSYSISL